MSTETVMQNENVAPVIENTESISTLTQPDKLMVQGVAIHSGVSRNGIMYTAEELTKFSQTMQGVSIIKDHRAEIDSVVGVVEKTKSMKNGNEVRYEGWVKDKDVAEKIREKMVRNVSIGALATMVKETEDSEYLIATNMQGVELSLVVVPGVPGATIQQSLTAHENAKSTEEKLKIKPISEDVKNFISLEQWRETQEAKKPCLSVTEKAKEEKNDVLQVDNNQKVDEKIVVSKEQMEEPKMADESKLTEMQASLAEKDMELAKLKAANVKLAEEKRQVLVESYKKLCKEKSVEEQKVDEMSEDVIKALVTQLEKTKVATQETKLRGQVGEPTQEAKFDESFRYEKSSIGRGNAFFVESYNPAKHKRLAR